MRHIQLERQLRIRFPGKSEAFDDGVEIGIVSALMALNVTSFTRWISPDVVEQAAAVAEKLSYRMEATHEGFEKIEVVFERTSIRPHLRVVG